MNRIYNYLNIIRFRYMALEKRKGKVDADLFLMLALPILVKELKKEYCDESETDN